MVGMLLLLIVGTILAALGLAAMRWGVDSRDSSYRIR